MKTLVDTSVWIRFLRGREPWQTELSQMLARGRVLGHAFVFGELLVGDSGDRSALLALYGRMAQAKRVKHEDVVTFVRARRLQGRGVGWSDAHLLASVVVEGAQLWTADGALREVAEELEVSRTAG